jgi:hypothetical protein
MVANDSGPRGVALRLNGDAGSSYQNLNLVLTGSAVPSAEAGAATDRARYGVCYLQTVAGGASFEISIPSYRSTAWAKRFMAWCMAWNGTAYEHRDHYAGWGGTAAINRITLIIDGTGNYMAGSEVSLYGIGPNALAPLPTDVYCQVPQGQNPSTSCANGLWTQVLIPAVGASFVISKSDGTNDDFTRNADGSVTINRAGNYHLDANVAEIATAWPDGASINFGLSKANGRLPTTSDWLVVGEYTSGSATNNYPSCPVSCDIFCAAGDRIAGWLWHNSGAARNIALRNFSITLQGAGPPGPPGGKLSQSYAVTSGYTADRAFNPEATSLTEVARVLGSLLDDMKAAGLTP